MLEDGCWKTDVLLKKVKRLSVSLSTKSKSKKLGEALCKKLVT
jgi:hypothetical protein